MVAVEIGARAKMKLRALDGTVDLPLFLSHLRGGFPEFVANRIVRGVCVAESVK